MTHVGMECLVLAVRPEGVFRVPDGEASRRAGSRKSDTANRERTLDAPPATGWAAWDAWCDARIKQALDERQRFLFDVLAETLAGWPRMSVRPPSASRPIDLLMLPGTGVTPRTPGEGDLPPLGPAAVAGGACSPRGFAA